MTTTASVHLKIRTDAFLRSLLFLSTHETKCYNGKRDAYNEGRLDVSALLKEKLPLSSVASALLKHVAEVEDREFRVLDHLVLHLQLSQSAVKVLHHHIKMGLAQPFIEQSAVTGQNEVFNIEVFRNFSESEADDVELMPL